MAEKIYSKKSWLEELIGLKERPEYITYMNSISIFSKKTTPKAHLKKTKQTIKK